MESFWLLAESNCLAKSNPSGTIIVTTINVYVEVSVVRNKNLKLGQMWCIYDLWCDFELSVCSLGAQGPGTCVTFVV